VSQARSNRPSLRGLVVALSTFVMLGLIDGGLGVAWPSMREFFDRGVAELGLLLAFGSAGYLTASAGYGRLHRRWGTGALLGAGSTLLFVGVTGFAFGPAWGVVAGSAVLLGLGGGLVDTGMNAHAALAFDVGSINLLHACYGVGATLGPVVITLSLVTSDSWRWGYAAMAVLQVLTAAGVWARRSRWAGSEPDLAGESPGTGARAPLLFLVVLFFLYTGVEVGAGQWAFTLLSEGRGMSTAAAGVWVAIYWGGLTVGRFGFGLVGDRLTPSRILNGSMVVSLAGIGWLWMDPGGLGVVGLPVAGLGFAAVFPTLVSVTPARLGRVRSTKAMGYQLAAANLGAAAVPWVLGIIAESRGVASLAPGMFVASVALTMVYAASERFTSGGASVTAKRGPDGPDQL
jgi:fucose permease